MKNFFITFFIPSITLGGAEKSLIKLANILAENTNNQIKIITVKILDEKQIKNFPIPINKKIKFFSLNGKSIRNFKTWYNLIQFTKMNPSNIFCCWSYSPSTLGSLLKSFLNTEKLMISVRDVYDEKSFFKKHIRSFFFKRADVITANSFQNLQRIQSFLGDDAITYKLLKNTIETKKVDELSKLKLNLKGVDFKNKDVINILSVGRITHQKGFDILIESIALIPSEYNFTLTVIGKGPMLDSLKLRGVKLGISDKINWLGAKSNPYPYYSKFDLLVFPSRHEGFPNVLLESMVIGIPVISTNCLTGPNELLENGKFGQLISVDDPALLSQAIIRFFKNKTHYIDLANKRKKQLIKSYDSNIIKSEYIEIFNCQNE
jgi:glycosyltransferase involved in cell wall biosynthesis